MAQLLFIGESGQDRAGSPYEVLAGVTIEDQALWSRIKGLHDAEISPFGRRYSDSTRELQGKKILKAKTFRLANLYCEILPHEVPILASECLEDGARNLSVQHRTALALYESEFGFC